MSYSENGNGTNFTMPVQPYGGNGGWGNGSFFGDGAWWLIILLLFANRKSHTSPYIVVVTCEDHASEKKVTEYLKTKTEKCQVKSKTAQKGQVELNMEIRLKNDNTDFINELADLSGVGHAVLASYNGDYMG